MDLYRAFVEASPDPSHQAEALHNMGILAHAAGSRKEALGYLGDALRLEPRVANFHNSHGVVLRAQGQAAAAVAAFKRAVALDPAHHHAHLALAGTLHFDVADRAGEAEGRGGRDGWDGRRVAAAAAAEHYAAGLALMAPGILDRDLDTAAVDTAAVKAVVAAATPQLLDLLNDLAIALQKAGDAPTALEVGPPPKPVTSLALEWLPSLIGFRATALPLVTRAGRAFRYFQPLKLTPKIPSAPHC